MLNSGCEIAFLNFLFLKKLFFNYLVKICCLQLSLDIQNWSFCPVALTSYIGTLLSHHQLQTLNLFSKSFLCTIAPMPRIRNRTDNFFSPLIFILKWQTKGTCIQHPKLDLNVYKWRLMLPTKIEDQECFPSSKAIQVGQSVYNP